MGFQLVLLSHAIFPNHQYGQQTTIGTIKHLKNPSLKEIQKYYDKYYVPNNMAICMSGDFEYDQVIKLIDKYFGVFERKEDPLFEVYNEAEIQSPKITNIYGPEAERLYVGFRLNGIHSKDAMLLRMVDMVLSNTSAGLIDINLNQAQRLVGGGCFPYILNDYSIHGFYGSPNNGQTLEEVKDLLLSQLDEIKKICDVPPSSFSPPPKVFSSLVVFEPIKNDLRLDISLEKYIDKLLRISFNSRRKMIRNTLNSILSNEEINELSESSKVCFNLRPQDISIDQWIKLAENCIKIKK